eukprot:scaffold172956_cov31-Tisochrysis_lutea.AAC.2
MSQVETLRMYLEEALGGEDVFKRVYGPTAKKAGTPRVYACIYGGRSFRVRDSGLIGVKDMRSLSRAPVPTWGSPPLSSKSNWRAPSVEHGGIVRLACLTRTSTRQ